MRSGFNYNGEVLDDDGLLYLRARYYNLIIGQFIQQDKNKGSLSNIASQNRYAFAMQNPNRYIDKDGRMAIQMSDRRGHSEENNLTYKSEKLKKEREEKALKKALKKLDKQPAKAPVKYNGGGTANVKGISVVGNAVTKGAKPKPVKDTGNKGKSSKKQPDCKKHWYDGVVNGVQDIWHGVKRRAVDTWNGITSGVDSFLKDPGGFLSDIEKSLLSPRFSLQASMTTMLAVLTGGQSLWVQSLVMGTGFTLSGEGYDLAQSGYDGDTFLKNKGAKNWFDYAGGLFFDNSFNIGTMYVGSKLAEKIHSKGTSGAGTKLEAPKYDTSKLQHEFKHASDFGINGNWNSANGETFKNALNNHMTTSDTILKSTYRGDDVVVYINKMTGNGAYYDFSGNFIGGWKLSAEQLQFHLKNGTPIK